MRCRRAGYAVAGAVALALCCGGARADIWHSTPVNGTLTDTLSWYTTAPGQSPSTLTGDGMNDATGPVNVSDLSMNGASTYTFQDTFTNPNGSYPASNQIKGQNYGFVDTFVLVLPNSATNAYAFSLDLTSSLGLDNLTARLYNYNANGFENLTIGGTGAVSGGTISGDNWSASSNGVVASTQLPIEDVAAGQYVLQLAGLETGTASGTYQLALDVTPVPLPAALPLLLTGLGVLGLGMRRRA